MKNLLVSLVALGAMLVGSTSLAQDVAIKVSPNVINLAASSTWVTVHTNIPFSSVDPDQPVTLNSIPATSCFADDCGNLVAKFDAEVIKAELEVGEVTLTLTGTTISGGVFSGSDTVKVISVKGK
jgi:hypothetical protein